MLYDDSCVSFSEFKKTLEEAIKSDTSGHFQRLLISLAQVLACWDFGICLLCVCSWYRLFGLVLVGFFFNLKKRSPSRPISNTSGSSNSFRETEMKVQMLTCLLSKEMCRSVKMLHHFCV